jgi:hypothetical protein
LRHTIEYYVYDVNPTPFPPATSPCSVTRTITQYIRKKQTPFIHRNLHLPLDQPRIFLARGTLSRVKILLVLLRSILHLLNEGGKRSIIGGRRILEPHDLRHLLDLSALHGLEARNCRAVDLRCELLVVGADVDALLLDLEHLGLCVFEGGGADLLLQGLYAIGSVSLMCRLHLEKKEK